MDSAHHTINVQLYEYLVQKNSNIKQHKKSSVIGCRLMASSLVMILALLAKCVRPVIGSSELRNSYLTFFNLPRPAATATATAATAATATA